LKKLALLVGASTKRNENEIIDAGTTELIHNIHQVLQTASMINICRSAREGYEIARKASNNSINTSKGAIIHFWISTGISLISTAAWLAAVAAINN
jgi:hypothetical protein